MCHTFLSNKGNTRSYFNTPHVHSAVCVCEIGKMEIYHGHGEQWTYIWLTTTEFNHSKYNTLQTFFESKFPYRWVYNEKATVEARFEKCPLCGEVHLGLRSLRPPPVDGMWGGGRPTPPKALPPTPPQITSPHPPPRTTPPKYQPTHIRYNLTTPSPTQITPLLTLTLPFQSK